MDIGERDLHYRWLDSPSEPVVIDEMPNRELAPHPQPSDVGSEWIESEPQSERNASADEAGSLASTAH